MKKSFIKVDIESHSHPLEVSLAHPAPHQPTCVADPHLAGASRGLQCAHLCRCEQIQTHRCPRLLSREPPSCKCCSALGFSTEQYIPEASDPGHWNASQHKGALCSRHLSALLGPANAEDSAGPLHRLSKIWSQENALVTAKSTSCVFDHSLRTKIVKERRLSIFSLEK